MTNDKKIYYFLILSLTAFFLTFCKKEKKSDTTSCYSETFYQEHKNDVCLTDCPGVIGRDGKNYCNLCIMHAAGIPRTQ